MDVHTVAPLVVLSAASRRTFMELNLRDLKHIGILQDTGTHEMKYHSMEYTLSACEWLYMAKMNVTVE